MTHRWHRLQTRFGMVAFPDLGPEDRPRQGLRQDRRTERRARGLPGDGQPRVDQGDGAALTPATWTADELERIAAADELMAPLRRDGTLRKPVTIWVVRLGDDLYIRSVYGRTPSWFRAAQVRHEGHRREALAWCAAPTTAMTHIAIQEGYLKVVR
jgi:hypothetical protein